MVVDLAGNKAAIPGSGNTPVVFTHTRDVAAATVKLVELPRWKVDNYIIGDKLSFNELVDKVQNIKGTWTGFGKYLYMSCKLPSYSLASNVIVLTDAIHGLRRFQARGCI